MNEKINNKKKKKHSATQYNVEEQSRISKILSSFSEMYPNAKTELNYDNPFQLLIATILAAQCTDKRVNKVTERLFKKYKGPEDFTIVSQEELENDIKECGLFRNKSKNIIGTSKMILTNHDGKVPATFEDLIKLPGVGRKTANVILANAFATPAFAVDTHVYRLAHRIGLSDKKDVLGVEKDLMEQIPKNLWIKAHHWLILHGRNLCKARKPMCSICFIEQWCPKLFN